MAIRAKQLQPAKIEAIASTKAILEGYSDYIFADYRGVTVEQITALRDHLRAKKCTFKILKNNFARIAFEELKVENAADFLKGPTAVVLSKSEANEIAKVLYDFAVETPALEIKGGLISNEVYDSAKLQVFSKLPGKNQLIAMLMSTINAPVQKIAATLQAYVDKKSAEEKASA